MNSIKHPHDYSFCKNYNFDIFIAYYKHEHFFLLSYRTFIRTIRLINYVVKKFFHLKKKIIEIINCFTIMT